MNNEWIEKDRNITKVKSILEKCAEQINVEIMSLVLYGSRAKGDRNSQNDYEIVVLVSNDTELDKYIYFNNRVRLEILKHKMFQVKVMTYTPDIFETILYNDTMVGTFLYILCRESIIIFDTLSTFTGIKERLACYDKKKEEEFLSQCVEFAKTLGSEKWERKWEKTLMQVKYINSRRKYL